MDGFIKKYWPFLKKLKVPVIINIWGTTVDEYAEVARRFDALGGVGALELNVSCPNIKEGGAQFGTDVKLLAQVVTACRKVTKLPLITKMSPNVVSIAPYAKAAEEAGSDALAVTNSYPAMAIDIETRKPKLANVTGGLTGPCIKPIAIKLVWEAAKVVKIPIIGMGGIQNAADAIEFMMAGATAVAVGTANFYEPQTTLQVIAGIREFMQKTRHQGRARNHRQRPDGQVNCFFYVRTSFKTVVAAPGVLSAPGAERGVGSAGHRVRAGHRDGRLPRL